VRFGVYDALTRSPPPYSLRVATSLFDTAGHLTARWYQVMGALHRGRPLGEQGGPGTEEQWTHHRLALAAIHQELRRRDIELIVVVLPYRKALTSGDPSDRTTHQRLVSEARDLGIETLDAWQVIDNLIEHEGEAAVFVPRFRDDVHFDVAGHTAIAEWLEPHVISRMVASR